MTGVGSVLLIAKGLDLGGVERVVVDLAKALRGHSVAVEVAVVNGRRRQFAPPLEALGVPVHLLDGTDRIGVSGFRQLATLLRRKQFDVIHAHGPLPAVIARVAAGRRPVVSTVHTVWSAHRGASRLAWRVTARLDAATIAVSDAVARSLPSAVSARTSVVPHGVDDEAVRSARRSAVPSGPADVPTVVVVASHREAKNYPNLLQALRVAGGRGSRFRVLAIGEGPRLDEHRRMATELGVAERIDFLEPRLDVLSTIAAADLLVVASDHEGQPLVVSEALALGVPVVSTSVGRVPELVGSHVGRVVGTGDPEALGAALVELLDDPELRHRMSAAAVLLEHRSLDDVVAEHLDIYRRVAAR